MGKFVLFTGFILIIVWASLHAFASPYLDEEKLLLVKDSHRICIQNDQCTLTTDTYGGCDFRYAINQSKGWYYEIAKFYRMVVDTVARKEPVVLAECNTQQGIPVCEENFCILDPDAPSNTYF